MHAPEPTTPSARARDHLRVVICGSVDDGKSTLIGRLLAETNSVPDDQLAGLKVLSQRYGTTGEDLDYALLLDGLENEREQGITIDVAYRYFATSRRAFVIADTPGHEQYTRNMVTGASNAEVAVLLVDVRAGLTAQTRRHARIVSLLGIRDVVLVVNKMDLAGFAQAAFAKVADDFCRFAAGLGFRAVEIIPAAARYGDNVAAASGRLGWYGGPSLLGYLETVEPGGAEAAKPLRIAVQSVTRADDFRGYAGIVARGEVVRGEEIAVARTGQRTRITALLGAAGETARAREGDAVTVVVADHTDIGRGDVLADPEAQPERADQFAAHVVWMDEAPLLRGRTYVMKIGTQSIPVAVTAIKHKIEIESGLAKAAATLEMNDIGFCNLATSVPVSFDPYEQNRFMGGFILIDRTTAATAGAGMIAFGLRRAHNVKEQHFAVDKNARAHMKGQKPCILWFTGLSGAGKSTVMNLVEQRLMRAGMHTYVLDGDNVRRRLNRDLGFTDADRVENIRRVGEVARLMVDAGLIVLCAFISPFREERTMVRELVEAGEFIEIFVDAPLSLCMQRDPKGLYAKARQGLATHVTGIDSAYEPPLHPEIRLDTSTLSPERSAQAVLDELLRRGIIAHT